MNVVDLDKVLEKAFQIRYFEERLLEEYKKGEIHGTIHTCIGQEIFPCLLSEFTKEYHWFSNHRGHGHYIAKTNDFKGLAAEILLKEGAIAGGAGGSQHLRSNNFLSNGIQGGQAGIASGYSSNLLNNSKYKSVMFLGDGTLGAGHIYEVFNLALLHNSKILFVLEDNKVAQSTPSSRTFSGDIKKITEGYGLEYLHCTSNEINSMQDAIEKAVDKKNDKPVFIHLNTNRLSSHSKSDDNRGDNHIDKIKSKDIINKKLSEGKLSYDSEYIDYVKNIFNELISSKDYYYKPLKENKKKKLNHNIEISNSSKFSDHINESLESFLSKNNNSIIIGEDIEDDPFNSGKIYGGAFKVTKGLSTKYPDQVISMPISESGFTGFGTGLALRGDYVFVEVMFADFLSQSFDQIFHQISKIPSIYGTKVDLPIFIRTAGFAGNGYGPTHSGSMEGVFFGLPNLDIFVPNLYSHYSNILNYFKETKAPLLVVETKSNYTKNIKPPIYGEYKESTEEFITIIEPKERKPAVTIFAYGPELDFIVSNLEYLASEFEIYVNIFSPINITNINNEKLIKLLEKSNNKIITINQSILNTNIANHWISELLKIHKIEHYNSNEIGDWIPTGRSEKEVLINIEDLIKMINKTNE